MNNNKNANQAKLSFNFLKFLSLCALVTSTTTAAIEPLPSRQQFTPVKEQQAVGQDSASHPGIESNEAVLEEIELEREWERIYGDDSETELPVYAYSTDAV